ncbi:hypothetical protein L207DRAFT_523231 [Hyaloscypha variabilis F]|uniref:Uncharacterized protein n=1 Tax=Hyaloscypha variabilis (strain UAMH 11265 / GT02V1 / F) TaxID=1149755 RepID=A0A2J6SAT8_HYAVF|nr:hypothetical protein L207DRAFT_523231 [Hyaloscypha variabilis F]
MNTLVNLRFLRNSLNELRAEIRATLDAQQRDHARSVVANERAIAALERDFRASEKDNNSKVKELESTVKVLIDAHNRKRDDLEGIEREVRRQCTKRPKLKPTRRSFTSKHNMSMQKNPKTTKPPLYSAVESAATPFQSTNAPKATPFLEQNRQEPHHQHRDLEAAINRLSDELSQQRKALDKLTQKIEEEKEYQLAADRARDRMIRALEDPLKSVYSADWNKYLRGYGILNRT